MSALLPHPGEILKSYFEQRKKARPRYSLRAMARDLEMSPAFISQVLSQQRSPSMSTAEKFIRLLKIHKTDASILRKSVALHSRENKEVGKVLNEYLKRDPSALAFKKYKQKSFESLKAMTHWHQMALMELITCEDYQSDERLMAQKLQIPLTDLRASLWSLADHGLIERVDGKWRKKTLHQDFATATTHEAARQYHRTMTHKALDVLGFTTEEEVSRRQMLGATLAVNPENLERAVEELNNFLFKMTNLLGNGACAEVYQLNLHLFPLTKAKENQ